MTFRGTYRDGVIELDSVGNLSNGTRMESHPAVPRTGPGSAYRLHELAADKTGLPRDYAAQIDHYLYGTPKKGKTKRTAARKSGGRKTGSAKKKRGR